MPQLADTVNCRCVAWCRSVAYCSAHTRTAVSAVDKKTLFVALLVCSIWSGSTTVSLNATVISFRFVLDCRLIVR